MGLLEKIHEPKDLRGLNLTDLNSLAQEIRQEMIKVVSKNGGHLAPNLGVVELTLALHRIFNSPHDKIVWDVGHQTYVHKLLTGRLKQFKTIRQYKGLSGFPKRGKVPTTVLKPDTPVLPFRQLLGLLKLGMFSKRVTTLWRSSEMEL